MTDSAAQIDAIIAQEEQVLKAAVAQALVAVNARRPGATADYQRAQKAFQAYQRRQAAEGDGGRFSTFIEAARWVMSQGYLVKERSAHDHLKRNIPRQKDGSLLLSQVEAYARRTWENPARPIVDTEESSDHRSRLIKEQADKLALANEITRGLYLLKSEVEQRSAARLAFLKQDLANFGPFLVDRLLEQVAAFLKANGIDIDSCSITSITPDLVADYDRHLERWLDRYARSGENGHP